MVVVEAGRRAPLLQGEREVGEIPALAGAVRSEDKENGPGQKIGHCRTGLLWTKNDKKTGHRSGRWEGSGGSGITWKACADP